MVSNTIQCLKVKLKTGAIHKVKAWIQGLYDNLPEVNAHYNNEEIIFQNIFLEYDGKHHYILVIIKAKNIEKANQAFEASNHPIDLEARRIIQEAWDINHITQLEPLLDLQPAFS